MRSFAQFCVAMSDPKTLAPHDQGPSLDKTNRTNTQDSARQFMIPHLAPLTDAHVSSYYPDALMCRSTLSQEPPSSKSTSSGSQSCKNCPVSSVSTKLDNHESEPLEWLKFRLASGFFAYFLCGWGDGDPILIADSNLTRLHHCISLEHDDILLALHWQHLRARHLSLIFASVLHAAFFVMVGFQGSYAVTWLAYAIAALARSFITATLNAYFVSGPPQSSVGYAYGLWSVGGMLSPIVCQTIIAKGVHWSHFYFGSLVLSGINLTLIYWAFRPTAREIAREWSEAESEKISTPVQSSVATPDIARSSRNNYKAAPLASRSHTLALIMHVLIRVINSNIENSLSVALVGLFYGSIFPAILRLTNDILPSEVHMISMGLISAFASVGSGAWIAAPSLCLGLLKYGFIGPA
ncbi:hypothetical protein H0H93_014428 [Arthromyces matolae]|nr:hypothetical protein H0H93_014428 [Arthromyces matolae]